jgi:hypothetical protein
MLVFVVVFVIVRVRVCVRTYSCTAQHASAVPARVRELRKGREPLLHASCEVAIVTDRVVSSLLAGSWETENVYV